jgi:hypothetical protein
MNLFFLFLVVILALFLLTTTAVTEPENLRLNEPVRRFFRRFGVTFADDPVKIDFILQRFKNGRIIYFTNHNNKFVTDSVSDDKIEAQKFYQDYVERIKRKEYPGEYIVETTKINPQ